MVIAKLAPTPTASATRMPRHKPALLAALAELEQEDVEKKEERRGGPERRPATDQPQCETEAQRQRKRHARS